MTNSAAQIGASFSDYRGDANLGGSSLGVGKIDTNPILELAKYTAQYNEAEYKQRQLDAEKAAKELSDLTAYDLSTGIPKDSKILQENYQKLIDYVRENPDAVNYRNKEKYLEFNRMKNELALDIAGAKQRNIMFSGRMKGIGDNTNKDIAAVDEKALYEEIERKGIREPLDFEKKYNIEIPDVKEAPVASFEVYKRGTNEDQKGIWTTFDVKRGWEQGGVFSQGLMLNDDISSPEGIRKAISRKHNFFTKGADIFNSVVTKDSYVDDNGRVVKLKDENGKLIKGALPEPVKNLIGLIDGANTYITRKKDDIKAGVYLNQFGKPISFGEGELREEDYKTINYEDGIDARELGFLMVYQAHGGDTFKIQTIQTNTGTENKRTGATYASIEENRRQFNETQKERKTAITAAGEPPVVINFAGYTGTKNDLSMGELYAIDPTLVTNDFGSRKPSDKFDKTEIEFNSDGSVSVTQNKKKRIVSKEAIQKRAIEFQQSNLSERKGQSGQQPFTNTGAGATTAPSGTLNVPGAKKLN